MNWSTAISSIGSALNSAARVAVPLVGQFGPSLLAASLQPRTGHYSGGGGGARMASPFGGMGFMPGIAMPGGAMTTVGNPGMIQRGVDTLFGGPEAYPFGRSAVASAPGARMPHLMQVPHARGDGSVVTYVRAPAVAYSVSIRRKGRRCRPGR